MAEVEIHTEHPHAGEPFAQSVGVMVGVIGVLLSIVTILSHREHTAAVVYQTEANDQWAFFQAKKIREHTESVGAEVLSGLAADPAKIAPQLARLRQDQARYASDAIALQAQAQQREDDSKRAEKRALQFDFGEGFLELGLVMSSLYFLSHKRFFVAFGAAAALVGTAFGAVGWFI